MPLILPQPGFFELEEKRSKFIGYCTSASTEEEARAVINKIRSENPHAAHNVYAYAVGIQVHADKNKDRSKSQPQNITRCSDDGEPRGTAGLPVLNVFDKTGIINYVCVVTRYFGGTLLGAGGLVRAYGRTAKGAMEAAAPEELINYTQYKINCAYPSFDKLRYNLDKQQIEILHIGYTTFCDVLVNVKEAQLPAFEALVNENRYSAAVYSPPN